MYTLSQYRLVWLALVFSLLAAAHALAADDWTLRFSDDFNREQLGPDWSGPVATLREGTLLIGRENDMGNNFVGCLKAFPGAIRLEYDALAPTDQPCDLSAAVNCDGHDYSSGFLFGFGSQMNKLSQLVMHDQAVRQYDVRITPRQWHHVVCQREGLRFTHVIDGKTILQYTHPEPLRGPLHPHVGFYVWHLAQIDNVRVLTKPEQVPVVVAPAPQRPVLQLSSYPDPGKVLAAVEVPALPGTEEATPVQVRVSLRAPQGQQVAWAQVMTLPGMRENVILEAGKLQRGTYTATVTMQAGQQPYGSPARAEVRWPGRTPAFAGIKVLNNLVWELVSTTWINPEGRYEFRLPCDRWVFVRTRLKQDPEGALTVTLNPGPNATPLYTQRLPETVHENMRFLKAGRHTLELSLIGGAELALLQVRAVPEIQQSRYPSTVAINQGVAYDWDFMSRYLLPHVNTIVTSVPNETTTPQFQQWRAHGGRIISYQGRPGLHSNPEAESSGEHVAAYWGKAPGYTHPLLDGVLVDEFYTKDDKVYPAYTDGIKLLNERFPGRAYYPYAAGSFGKDQGSIPFAQACLEGGGYVCWEAYLAEWATLKDALNAMRRYPEHSVMPLEERLPGATRQTLWVFGVFSFPWPYADGYASADYNAYLDMQGQLLATHPALFGLGGMHIWRTGYCDEERLRWCGQLFRHYGLEGHTRRLGSDPYLLTHLQNPDFAAGTSGWTVQAAGGKSVEALTRPRFGKFIGRYYRGPDSFLVTRRAAGQPNAVSQEIRGLQAGRTYSVKLLTGNYGHLQAGKSERQVHPVRVEIAGAQRLEGHRFSYQEPFPTRGREGPFTDGQPFWLNYHWHVFRAEGPTAQLRLSDEPAAPGTEVLYTFVEVKPYLEP